MLLFVTTMIMPSMMWAQSITPTQPKGEGTLEKPYQIGTAAELYWFAGLVNGTLEGVEKNASADAILTTDITVNNGVLDANKDLVSKSDFIEWTPIGTSRDNAYTGTFDGKGYTVSGLYFNNPILFLCWLVWLHRSQRQDFQRRSFGFIFSVPYAGWRYMRKE